MEIFNNITVRTQSENTSDTISHNTKAIKSMTNTAEKKARNNKRKAKMADKFEKKEVKPVVTKKESKYTFNSIFLTFLRDLTPTVLKIMSHRPKSLNLKWLVIQSDLFLRISPYRIFI